jgi:uncharacterized protein (DUF488 family)
VVPPFFTIGHSTRPFEVFLDLTRASAIECVVDIRRIPQSRKFPQYGRDRLANALGLQGISYVHLAALGGRRSTVMTPSPNDLWRNAGFRHYADYAWTPAFQEALQLLITSGSRETCAVMCAEALWWRCHRRIVTDYLIARGHDVFHIESLRRTVRATLTPGVAVLPDGRLLYAQSPSTSPAAMESFTPQ